jgi:hypothetical protein
MNAVALPAPIRPRRFKCLARATRAERLRKWLVWGPRPLTQLAQDMGCTRYALRRTLDVMPDVIVTYGPHRHAMVALRAPARPIS